MIPRSLKIVQRIDNFFIYLYLSALFPFYFFEMSQALVRKNKKGLFYFLFKSFQAITTFFLAIGSAALLILSILALFLYSFVIDSLNFFKNILFFGHHIESEFHDIYQYYKFTKIFYNLAFNEHELSLTQSLDDSNAKKQFSFLTKCYFLKKLLLQLPDFWDQFVAYVHADQSNQLPVSTLLDDVLISGSTTDHQKLLLICKGLIFFNDLSSDHRVDDVNPDKKINARKFIASALSLFLDEDINLIKEEDIDLKLISHVESTCWTKLLLKLSKKIDSASFHMNEDILLALYEEAGHVLALLTKKLTTLDDAHQSLINKVLHLMEHNKIYELDKEFFIKISKPLSKNIHQIINYAAFYIETNHVYGIVQFFFSSYFFIDIKQILQESELVRINAAKLIHKVLHFNHNTQPLIASIVHHVLNNYTADEIYVFFRQTAKPDVHQLLSQIKAPTIKFLQNTEQLHQFKLLLNDFFNKVAKVKNPWFFSQLTLEVLTDCSSDRDLFLLKEHPSQSFGFLESLIPKIHSLKNLERFDVFSVFKSKDLLPMHSPEQLMCFFVIHCSSLIIYDKIASKYNYSGTDHQAIARDINTLYETLHHDVFLIFTLLEINTENKKQLINSCSAFVLKTIPLTLVFNRDGPDAPAQYKADYVRRIAAALFYRREKTSASEKIVNKLSIDLMSYAIQHLLNEENLKALANILTRPIMQRSRTIFTEYPVVQIDKTIYTAITKMPLHYLLLRNLLNQYLNDIFTAYKEKKISPLVAALMNDNTLLNVINEGVHNYISFLSEEELAELITDVKIQSSTCHLPLEKFIRQYRTQPLTHGQLKSLGNILISIFGLVESFSIQSALAKTPTLLISSYKAGASSYDIVSSSVNSAAIAVYKQALTFHDPRKKQEDFNILLNEVSIIFSRTLNLSSLDNDFSVAQVLLHLKRSNKTLYQALSHIFSQKKEDILPLKEVVVASISEDAQSNSVDHIIGNIASRLASSLRLFAILIYDNEDIPIVVSDCKKKHIFIIANIYQKNISMLSLDDKRQYEAFLKKSKVKSPDFL